jgi:hypothetical protein
LPISSDCDVDDTEDDEHSKGEDDCEHDTRHDTLLLVDARRGTTHAVARQPAGKGFQVGQPTKGHTPDSVNINRSSMSNATIRLHIVAGHARWYMSGRVPVSCTLNEVDAALARYPLDGGWCEPHQCGDGAC